MVRGSVNNARKGTRRGAAQSAIHRREREETRRATVRGVACKRRRHGRVGWSEAAD